jgi:hypothetical protein
MRWAILGHPPHVTWLDKFEAKSMLDQVGVAWTGLDSGVGRDACFSGLNFLVSLGGIWSPWVGLGVRFRGG